MSEQLQPESQTSATNRIVRQSQERRQRSKIPLPRTVSLVENAFSTEHPIEQANNIGLLTVSPVSPTPNSTISGATNPPPSNEGHISSLPEELKVSKGTTIRLQADVRQQLNIDIAAKSYTIETFVEAAWLQLQEHPELLETVISEAQRRCSLRKQYGRVKAAQTFSEAFTNRES